MKEIVQILAIGDTANNAYTLSKYIKKSKIHIINFPRIGPAKFTYSDNVEFFNSIKITEQIKKVNEIKHNYDLCLTTSWEGARVAYLSNLNYIMYFVGEGANSQPFVKNARVPYLKEPIHKKNILERKFLKNVFENAITCVTYGGKNYLNEIRKYRKDVIRMDMIPVDTEKFNQKTTPIKKEKSKFTFLSPQRQSLGKGIDLIWKALPLCKTDFEILQVDWYDKRNSEEEKIIKKFFEERPEKVKLIPLIKTEEMPKYYAYADAVLGQMGEAALCGGIEREAVFCGKPVLHYSNTGVTYLINDEEKIAPFLPRTREPKDLAETIDKLVLSEEFRRELFEKEFEFVNQLSEPHIVAEKWDLLFQLLHEKTSAIIRKRSKTSLFIQKIGLRLTEKLIYEKRWVKRKAYK